MDSAYESTFLFQSQFPLSATKLRSTQTGGEPSCIAEGGDTASWERSTNMVPLLKKEEDMDDTTTLSTLQFVFDLFFPDCHSILSAPFT